MSYSLGHKELSLSYVKIFCGSLNAGSEAAEKIFERDAKKAAFKAKSGAVGRGKQMVTKRGRK